MQYQRRVLLISCRRCSATLASGTPAGTLMPVTTCGRVVRSFSHMSSSNELARFALWQEIVKEGTNCFSPVCFLLPGQGEGNVE